MILKTSDIEALATSIEATLRDQLPHESVQMTRILNLLEQHLPKKLFWEFIDNWRTLLLTGSPKAARPNIDNGCLKPQSQKDWARILAEVLLRGSKTGASHWRERIKNILSETRYRVSMKSGREWKYWRDQLHMERMRRVYRRRRATESPDYDGAQRIAGSQAIQNLQIVRGIVYGVQASEQKIRTLKEFLR